MIIVIDGIIGSGKSSVLKEFEKIGYLTEQQPVHEWTLLKHYYRNPKKYAMPCHLQILSSYQKIWEKHKWKKSIRNNDVILEACGLTSTEVYGKMLLQRGILSPEDYKTLETMIPLFGVADIFVYLECNLHIALQRTKARGRPGEENVTLDYQKSLHKFYEKFMEDYRNQRLFELKMRIVNI